MLNVVAISDTHNMHETLEIPECDILIHSGDLTMLGYLHSIKRFLKWFNAQPAKHKVFICGNHDFLFQEGQPIIKELMEEFPDIHYLFDSAVEIEGYVIYGSPWQPWWHDWAFNAPENDKGEFLKKKWAEIPDNTDILVTHGPPKNILDRVNRPPGMRVGCPHLFDRVMEVKPRYHIFGHIHECGGLQNHWKHDDGSETKFINASSSNAQHRVENKPIFFSLPRRV